MLHSVFTSRSSDSNLLPGSFRLPDPLPWTALSGPLAAAEDGLARLDECLARSPIRAGWIARSHLSDSAASLWLDGELVRLEDLVLHDARMDVRAPSHELTRAHAVLRARRRIAAAKPGWGLSTGGLDGLRGKGGEAATASPDGKGASVPDRIETPEGEIWQAETWEEELAAIDAVVARSERLLRAEPPSREEPEGDGEEERLARWRVRLAETDALPPLLAAAYAGQAWEAIAPLRRTAWLGRLMVPAVLQARGKTLAHLACLNSGLRSLPRASREGGASAQTWLEAMAGAATQGLKDHDRWLAAREGLERKLAGRRSTSKLPALIDFVLATPLASAGMIARALGVTPRAAQDLVAELGLREVTGRGRYRAWGFF